MIYRMSWAAAMRVAQMRHVPRLRVQRAAPVNARLWGKDDVELDITIDEATKLASDGYRTEPA